MHVDMESFRSRHHDVALNAIYLTDRDPESIGGTSVRPHARESDQRDSRETQPRPKTC